MGERSLNGENKGAFLWENPNPDSVVSKNGFCVSLPQSENGLIRD